MTKKEETQALLAKIAELEAKLAQKNTRVLGPSRADLIVNLLKQGPASVKQIAVSLGPDITTRNVSTVLSGLRKAGFVIHTDEQHRKYLVATPADE